ncbi:hypothetical protein ABMA27_011224 [Loxostege sticticalis]|uniref:CCHC-type domain-containing protein n=1 Tax=Loxostege sticticalis TaxID=481309 RepID=A0ABR3H236_LOXSC
MDGDEEAAAAAAAAAELQQKLIDDEVARKKEELRVLAEMAAEAVTFKPRQSLVRTPPSGLSTPPPLEQLQEQSVGPKRPLGSPEEVQDSVRRRINERRQVLAAQPRPSTSSSVPPPQIAQQTRPAPSVAPAEVGLAAKSKVQLLDMVHAAIKGIAQVTNASNKLNIGDKTTVASHSQDILAIVAALELKYAELEHQLTATKLQVAHAELDLSKRLLSTSGPGPAQPASLPAVPSYAGALKLPKGKAPIPVQQQGPAVIFYPADEAIKSSEDTKKTLQQAVKPSTAGIQIRSVRMVGNSGIVVRTASNEAAQKLKAAAPPNLKVAEPKARQPRVALRYLRQNIAEQEILDSLHQANLADDASWSLEKFRASCKVAVKKPVGPKFLLILECSMALREKLVADHIRATCCNKCQQYGHPEKYCRAKETTCGKCGETGHKSPECQSAAQCCATCKRFKRKDAHTHPTAAASCPARQHAEQQAVSMLQYN